MRSTLTCLATFFLLQSPGRTAEDWPDFRGPHANGHSAAKNMPVQWSNDQGIQWKIPLPGLGWSTPIVSKGTIWLTTSLEDGKSLHALAIDGPTGKILHDVPVFPNNEPKAIHDKNSHASPSAVVDGDNIYLHFGTYGTTCIDAKGNVLWTQKLVYEPQHGPGGSPIIFEDLLIVNCDGTDVQFVTALDKHTGEIRWKTLRTHADPGRLDGTKSPPMAFSTPVLWHHQGTTQLVSSGADHVAGYDPRTGKELWWSKYDGYSIVLRPTIAEDIVFVSSCYNDPVLYAIRLGGEGEVTQSRTVWTLNKAVPHSPSPLIVDNEIYLFSDNGIATCLDAKSGHQHWQHRLGGNYSASPLYADGHIYILSEGGETTVIQPGLEYRELAKNSVNGRTLASFGVLENSLLLRTDTELLRIGTKP